MKIQWKASDRTKIAWIALGTFVFCVFFGVVIYPVLATKWNILIQFKDQVYKLIIEAKDAIWVTVANGLGLSAEKSIRNRGGNLNVQSSAETGKEE